MAKRKSTGLGLLIIVILIIFTILYYLGIKYPSSSLDSSINANNNFPSTNNSTQDNNFNSSSDSNLINSNISVYFCPDSNNCERTILNLIDSSTKSIDCAVYDLTLDSISDALVSAKKDRNVNIRFVSDNLSSSKKTSNIGQLKASNISVILNPDSENYMHNKFCVFDGEISLIGSTNFTDNCIFKNNNNFVVIENKEFSNILTEKIDSFFQGKFSQKVISNSVKRKLDNSKLEIYFCPEDDCKTKFLDVIESSKTSLDCMFFSYTLDEAQISMRELKDNNSQVRVIFEKSQNSKYSEYQKLIDYNISAIIDKNPNNMHNKLCIIDKKIVTTGSMNLTAHATEENDESLLIIYDENIAKSYSNYFEKYWKSWK
ncbi:MAG: phospholipase D-like domain-containing protein [archaeon]